MTEEIIIDGVNVAGCIYFQQEDDEYTCGAEECNGAVVGCRACDNCYYKQLKRLEQENKELKETVKDLNQSIQNCNIQRTKMYKALEEIRELTVIGVNASQCNCGLRALADDILNKINEVFNDK